MSKIAGDINAEMMKKAIHDSRSKLFAEIVGKTGSQQSVIDCAMQEIESLCQQLASRDAEVEQLRQQLAAAQSQYQSAVVGRRMFRGALSETRSRLDTAWAQAHRLALELECLLLDTKDNAVVSKWWDSGMEALSEYQELQPGAKEEAEAWAKMRREPLCAYVKQCNKF